MANKRVLLGMSGGTDSSVAAMLLLKEGYDVIGVTFNFYEIDKEELDGNDAISTAQKLAQKLGIEHHLIDLQIDFSNCVINYFTEGYLNGETPFPCAYCNPKVKWKYLTEYADKFNCSYISTGHYVRKFDVGARNYIYKGIDLDKDQSFFLWGLNNDILKRTIFPLGGFTKNRVREIAREKGFEHIAEKKDSLGICFISQSDYRPFLEQNLENKGINIKPGNFINVSGEVLGKHKGYPYYTIGQRKGLGLNLNYPQFVLEIRAETNEVVLGKFEGLLKNSIELKDVHFLNRNEINMDNVYIVKIRYRNQATPCSIVLKTNNTATIQLGEPLSAIAPGQAAAFYDGDRLLGGGFIVSAK